MPSITLAECLDRFDRALVVLRANFSLLESILPSPIPTLITQGLKLRYHEQLIEQAILMKLARLISLLGAMRTLVEDGYVAEQGIIQRAADETQEDIFFLAFGKQNGLKRVHKQFLRHFWREEFEDSTAPASYRFRGGPRRQEIRDYVNEQTGGGRAQADEVSRVIYGVFSGFVHGASTHIFELLDPATKKYRLSGVRDAEDCQGYLDNALNYPYRALMGGALAALALGHKVVADGLFDEVKKYGTWFNQLRLE
jgi:hypothetical protein